MFDFDDDRHFKNDLKDFSLEDSKYYITSNNEITVGLKNNLIQKINEMLITLDNKLPQLNSKDVSIYTGLSGISYLYFKCLRSDIVEISNIAQNSKKNYEYLIKESLKNLKGRPGSFMCDDMGPLTMSVLMNIEKNNIDKIIKMSEYILNNNDIPDEILYGRSGYLAGILLLHKYKKNISVQFIKNVFKAIVNSGLKLSMERKEEIKDIPPLFYEWRGKPYLGGAHGVAGIMFMLLQVYLNEDLSEIQPEIKQDIFEYVCPTVKYLSKLRLSSGNYPSSLGSSSKRDVLIQWCHGAPGWIHMFIAAHKVTNDPIYLERIKEIGEIVWLRGLLYKGCGICHGSAGNGYVFLAIYQYTNDPKYLYRALKFAEWCTDYVNKRTREADRPYSLFEGLAGTIHYIIDCLDPKNSRFPVYEI